MNCIHNKFVELIKYESDSAAEYSPSEIRTSSGLVLAVQGVARTGNNAAP